MSPASEVELRFVGDADGTRVELSYHGWEGFGEIDGPVRRDGYVGPRTWGTVLDDFTDIGDRSLPGPTSRPSSRPTNRSSPRPLPMGSGPLLPASGRRNRSSPTSPSTTTISQRCVED